MSFMGKLFEIDQKLIEKHQFEIATKSEKSQKDESFFKRIIKMMK